MTKSHLEAESGGPRVGHAVLIRGPFKEGDILQCQHIERQHGVGNSSPGGIGGAGAGVRGAPGRVRVRRPPEGRRPVQRRAALVRRLQHPGLVLAGEQRPRVHWQHDLLRRHPLLQRSQRLVHLRLYPGGRQVHRPAARGLGAVPQRQRLLPGPHVLHQVLHLLRLGRVPHGLRRVPRHGVQPAHGHVRAAQQHLLLLAELQPRQPGGGVHAGPQHLRRVPGQQRGQRDPGPVPARTGHRRCHGRLRARLPARGPLSSGRHLVRRVRGLGRRPAQLAHPPRLPRPVQVRQRLPALPGRRLDFDRRGLHHDRPSCHPLSLEPSTARKACK